MSPTPAIPAVLLLSVAALLFRGTAPDLSRQLREVPARSATGGSVLAQPPRTGAPRETASPRAVRPAGMPSASPPASGTHPVTVTERVFTEQLPPLPPVPATAAHPASDARPAPGRPAVVAQLAGLWGEHDIAAALVWADELRGDDRSIAAETILRKVAESDPAGALAVAEHFGVGLHDGQAERILQLWAEAQPDEAISWMLARPAGPMRERLAVRLAWVRAQSDPADAVALTAALLPAGLHRDDAWLAIVRHWSARDPAGATAWVAGFPDGAVRDQAIELLSRPLITTGDAPR